MGWMLNTIESVAQAIEVLAVAIILGGILYSFVKCALAPGKQGVETYKQCKYDIGRSLLLGLELLVAADVIRTVALRPNFQNIGMLGILVLIRTFLSWSLVVEMEGRWPWTKKAEFVADHLAGTNAALSKTVSPLAGEAESKTMRGE